MGPASRRCASLCVPSPLQRGRQVLSDGGPVGVRHSQAQHAIYHATTNDSMRHGAIDTAQSMRTDGRAKTEQTRCIKKSVLERAEWPRVSSPRRSSGPEHPAAKPVPWPWPWHGPLQPGRCDGGPGASAPSRGTPGAQQASRTPTHVSQTTTPLSMPTGAGHPPTGRPNLSAAISTTPAAVLPPLPIFCNDQTKHPHCICRAGLCPGRFTRTWAGTPLCTQDGLNPPIEHHRLTQIPPLSVEANRTPPPYANTTPICVAGTYTPPRTQIPPLFVESGGAHLRKYHPYLCSGEGVTLPPRTV